MGKARPDLGEVQETLLVPLYGRARDATARRSILNDVRARELVNGIDYDFARFNRGLLLTTVLRTSVFDAWVRGFIGRYPTGTVVEIGTGLNTRFERTDNGQVRWFDLDLPDTIELRQRFFTRTDRQTMIAGSVLETDWFDTVNAGPGPHLFVAEGVFAYFTETQVHGVITNLAERFPGSLIAFDTYGAKIIGNMQRKALKAVNARMQWACDDPRRLADWGLHLVDSHTWASPLPEAAKTWPLHYRCGIPLLAKMIRDQRTYRLNLFRLADTERRL
ncbi:class I SAM-dependent methyltransferase [Mycobacterium malmoense]|nr:class I SAM-dependent methyltransferase [Mycobacterium malmoense]UNB93940.1 class I SAM-dependent methyltransferase [Mycobacterium malmoense]